jgi:hypothetical protein
MDACERSFQLNKIKISNHKIIAKDLNPTFQKRIMGRIQSLNRQFKNQSTNSNCFGLIIKVKQAAYSEDKKVYLSSYACMKSDQGFILPHLSGL